MTFALWGIGAIVALCSTFAANGGIGAYRGTAS